MKEQVLNAVFIARNCNTHKVGRKQGELLIFAFPHCCVTVINGLNNNKKIKSKQITRICCNMAQTCFLPTKRWNCEKI